MQNAIRYEVEFKGDRAWNVATELSRSRPESLEIRARVAGFFMEKGVSCRQFSDSYIHSGCQRSRSDKDKMLAWLRKSVRPSIEASINNGGLLEVLDALGLDHQTLLNLYPSGSFNEKERGHVST